MERKRNKLKQVLSEGRTALGTCVYSFSPALIELAGFTGLDFCRIDNEHAWRQDESGEAMLRGAQLADITALMRVDRDDPYIIRKALEAGAGGVIVPHTHDRKDVEDIVQAAKFPPVGKRGYGGLCLSGQWGVDAGVEWMEWCNRETLIVPMIEDVGTIEKIDEIMRVEGIDGVFFGPADFSISAGVPLQTGHDKVVSALKRVIDAANKYNRFVIYPAGFPQWETVKKYEEIGVHAIELGHDVSILKSVWQKAVCEIR